MSNAADSHSSVPHRHLGKGLRLIGRVGTAAKAVVYLVVGILAVMLAAGAGGQTVGSRGALRKIAEQPFGTTLLSVVAVGLLAYACWRLTQAIMDTEGLGRSATGMATRIGFTFSGLLYLSLAIASAGILGLWSGLGGSSTGRGGSTKQEAAMTLLSVPGGRWTVGVIGGLVAALALLQIKQAHAGNFMKLYRQSKMSDRLRRTALWAGRVGFVARAVAFAIVGCFLIRTALRHDPSQVGGLDKALETIRAATYGKWLLGLVAFGMLGFAVHCFIQAMYRSFSLSDAPDDEAGGSEKNASGPAAAAGAADL